MKDVAAKALPAEESQSIEPLIRSRYDDLSPSDRKLADVIVAHQKDLAAYSATELAQLAGVSFESPLFSLDRVTQAEDQHPGFTSHVETDIRNLATTLKLLKNARRIWVVGYRNGYASAFYARALFSHAKTDVSLVNEAASTSADVLVDMEKRDVLFVVDVCRRTRLLPKVVRVVCEAGASVVLLTYRYRMSPRWRT